MLRTTRLVLTIMLCAAWALGPGTRARAQEHGAADADHAAAAATHGAATENPIELKADLGVWTLVVFVILLIVLRRFAWGPLVESLDAREKHVREAVRAAECARDEAARLVAEHERKLAGAQNEVRAILDEARRDAQQTQADILKQAQAEAQSTRERAKREIEQARDQALKELFERSGEIATQIAARIIRRNLQPQDQRELVQQALNELSSKN